MTSDLTLMSWWIYAWIINR